MKTTRWIVQECPTVIFLRVGRPYKTEGAAIRACKRLEGTSRVLRYTKFDWGWSAVEVYCQGDCVHNLRPKEIYENHQRN